MKLRGLLMEIIWFGTSIIRLLLMDLVSYFLLKLRNTVAGTLDSCTLLNKLYKPMFYGICKKKFFAA